MPGDRAEGGGMAGIPSDIDFAAKKSKAATPLLQRHAQCIKACIDPIQHPGMIKFWAVHHKTMELYTLWWNGGLLASFLRNLNSKVSEVTPNDCIGWLGGDLLLEDLDKVMLYRKNRAKLALSLLIIVEKCCAHELQHNDLNPSNILLHFPPMDKTKIFLGVYDWGMTCRNSEVVTSNYGFQASNEMEMQRQLQQHVTHELFYVFGPHRSETCLERQKHSKVGDAYAAGMLAKMI